ncbi:MAG TPA: NAD(P)-dependent oxidoreductase [Candidatus Hydrogenedentes bacterium]|nr:NAD(P)-dependent oxidoreductase [Candidatus Hydrogenedentota bacterium]HPG67520.1 NAD(P)-dependent oxidoreductase [Candidatus Hydrogenedentota bacterium]
MGIVVAVTQPEYDKAAEKFRKAAVRGFNCLRAPISEARLAAAVRKSGARHVVLGVERYGGPLYDALEEGGVVARFGVGFDGLDMAKATARGLLCTNTPGVLDDSVAEHAITLILCAAKALSAHDRAVRGGAWTPQLGVELRGKRLAVIGCGAIGCRVARIASVGLGMRVTGCKVHPCDIKAMKQAYGFEAITCDFREAVKDADFVSLHIPSIAETAHFINAERLAWMRPRAWLINTARGAVVDERALVKALHSDALAGAALDVFEREPYAPAGIGEDLRALPNVIMTPHVGSSTHEACDRVADRVFHNLSCATQGDFRNMDLLNPEVLNGAP